MASADSSEILVKFKLCGVPTNELEKLVSEDVEWMGKIDSETQHFLNWFIENIDDRLVLSDSELLLNDSLCREPSVNEKDIILELANLGVTDASLELTELDLLDLKEETAVLQRQKDVLQELDLLLQKEIETDSEREKNAQYELKKLHMSLLGEGQSLMKTGALYKSTLNSFCFHASQFLSLFSKENGRQDNSGYLFSGMDLDSFIQQCSELDGQLQHFLKYHFKGATFHQSQHSEEEGGNSESRVNQAVSSFGDLPQKMWEASLAKIKYQAQLDAQIGAENHFKQLSEGIFRLPVSNFQIRLETKMLQEEISRISDEIDQYWKGTVSTIVEEETLCNITSVTKKIEQQRIDRRNETLEKLKTLHKYLDIRNYVAELVCMMFFREGKYISIASKTVSEAYEFFEQELSFQSSVMDNLHNLEKQHELWNSSPPEFKFSLVKVLHTLFGLDEDTIGIDSLIDAAKERESDTQVLESQMLDLLSTHLCQHKEGKESLDELIKVLNCGYTQQLSLYPSNALCSLEEVQAKLNRTSEEIVSLQKAVSVKKLALEPSYLKNLRFMWAWFLVQPNRFKEVVHGLFEMENRNEVSKGP